MNRSVLLFGRRSSMGGPALMAGDSGANNRFRILDEEAARRYLAGVEQLAREGKVTADPRVLRIALAVLGMAPTVVKELFR